MPLDTYHYVYICAYLRTFGRLPPDPFLGSWNVASWFCCFATAGSSLVRGNFVNPRRAFGEPWEVSGMALGGPEHVPGWLMMPMGGAGQPTSDLDLRFHIILAHLYI